MAEDAKGVYFGGGNSGLATVLNSNQTAQTQQRLDYQAQRKIAEQVKAKEDRDKQAEKLKNFDSWRYYSGALQKEYQSIADDLKAGKLDNIELQLRLNEYAGKAKSSLDLKSEYDDATKDYEKNKKVLGGAATEWYLDKYHASPTTDNLKKISSEPLNRYGFIDEQGGSKYINKTEAFKDVVENQLGGWVENTIKNDQAKGKVVARGLMEFAQSTDFTKTKSFAEVDPKTGQIRVKDVDKLIESGVVDLFEQDAYTNRILEDRTDEILGGKEVSPEERQRVKSLVLREVLQPYGATGEAKSDRSIGFQRYSPPPTGGSGSGSGGGSDGLQMAERFISIYDESGYVPGEKQRYTVDQLVKRGYSEGDAKKLVKDGATYVNSDAFLGQKSDSGTRLGYIQDTRFNKKVAPGKGGVLVPYIEVYTPKGKGEWDKEHKPLTIDLMRNYVPKGAFDDFEAKLRREGRIDENGNFIIGDNRLLESKLSKYEKR